MEENLEKTMAFPSLIRWHKICTLHLVRKRRAFQGADMVAYEFYWRDEFGDAYLLGILPERRKDQTRITNESIMNWVKKILGNGMVLDDIFFSKVNLNEF